jgi:hypothetical protein
MGVGGADDRMMGLMIEIEFLARNRRCGNSNLVLYDQTNLFASPPCVSNALPPLFLLLLLPHTRRTRLQLLRLPRGTERLSTRYFVRPPAARASA